MENTPQLYTQRLILRKFVEEDDQAMYKILSDRETNTFLPWFPAENIEQARKFMREHFLQTYKAATGWNYAVCQKEDNVPIGYVTVKSTDSRDFGYGLRHEFWHKGLMTEAAQAVVQSVRQSGIPYLTATHDRNNPRSGAVMQKIGMKYQYSYEEQWQPKNISVIFRMYQINLDGNSDRVFKKYWETSDVHFIETAL